MSPEGPSEYRQCPYCANKVKKDNFHDHVRRVHPKYKKESDAKPPAASRFVRPILRDGSVMLVGILLGIVLNPILGQILVPVIYFDTPSLVIGVYPNPVASFRKGGVDIYGIKWDSSYVDYNVEIQVKSKQTPVEYVMVEIDFGDRSAILKVEDSDIVGANPSVSFPRISISQNGIPVNTTQKPCQFFIFIRSITSDGLCSYHVVVDPNYRGPIFRNIIIGPNRYHAKFQYDAYGFKVVKEVAGQIR